MPSAAHQGATYEGDTTTTMTGGAVIAAMHMAGWPKSQWRTGAAVAYQESSWRPGITYRLADGRGMRGIMQINDDAHPEKIATGDWRNPVDNWKMALAIYNERGNWTPWEGYTDGNYRQYLGKADQAITEHAMAHRSAGQADTEASSVDMTLLEGSGVSVTPVGGADNGAVERLAAAVHWMTQESTWWRIGMFIAGALLLIIGLVWLVRSSAPVNKLAKQVNSVVSEVVPIGKIKKLGKGGKKSGKKSDAGNGTSESS